MDAGEIVLTAMRVWAGTVMLAHGANHVRSRDGTTRWFRSVGFRYPGIQARLSGYGELAIGSGLVVGVLTPVAAGGVIAVMCTAFWSIHRFAGFFVFARPDEGYEYVVTLSLAVLTVATVGPGPLSLDAVLGLADALDGAAGALIALAGVLVGASQLMLFWRKPESKA